MSSIGEIVRVALHYEVPNAGDVQNVFHFQISVSAPNDADLLDDIEDWVNDDWGNQWRLAAASNTELASFEVDVVAADGTVTRNIGGRIVGIVGTISGDGYAPQSSGYMLAYTAIPKARGSKYVPGLPEGILTNGGLSTSGITEYAKLLIVYLTVVSITGGGSLLPGVASRTLLQFVPFLTAGVFDTIVATQRRRKEGVGI